MNLSGNVVSKYLKYFNVDVSDVLIISDDLDLEVGKYRLRPSGGSGGHNGLKDISNSLGTDEFKRLRIGISNNKEIDTKDYVLGRFSDSEQKIINEVVDISKNIIEDFLKTSFNELMSKYNKKTQ